MLCCCTLPHVTTHPPPPCTHIKLLLQHIELLPLHTGRDSLPTQPSSSLQVASLLPSPLLLPNSQPVIPAYPQQPDASHRPPLHSQTIPIYRHLAFPTHSHRSPHTQSHMLHPHTGSLPIPLNISIDIIFPTQPGVTPASHDQTRGQTLSSHTNIPLPFTQSVSPPQ